MNRAPFAPEEWYHCYTRGVDKRATFTQTTDYERFQDLLYLCNSSSAVHRVTIFTRTEVFTTERPTTLVHIAAYCLMPNHFHLLLKEAIPGGVSMFMRKLGTAYTMYFNRRNERIGNLFVKPFRSKHITNDDYAKRVLAYIHLNPLDLLIPNWKEKEEISDLETAKSFLENYTFASLPDYINRENNRLEFPILSAEALSLFFNYQNNTSTTDLLRDALDFFVSR